MLTDQDLQITFRGLEHWGALEADVRAHATKLAHLYPGLTNCRVMLDAPHHHHHQGRLYHVRIVLHAPGTEIVVSHAQHDGHAREDPHVAIRDAFVAADRQLDDAARSPRHTDKGPTHSV